MNIIFEDDTLLVLDKPAGLVVDKSETQKIRTVENWLEDRLGSQGENLVRAGIVHRIDKDTSGLLLVAKTPEALENLQKQFQTRAVKKEYLALVHGLVEKGGVVDAAIIRNPENREKFIARPTRSGAWDLVGRQAVTEYEPLERLTMNDERLKNIFPEFNKIQLRKLRTTNYELFTLVTCFPRTGRTHQIRVHLKLVGHPIVSDEKYAGRKMVRLDKRWCPRQFLHAAKISFRHPISGEWMDFKSELPGDLVKVLDLLVRY